MPPGIGFIPLYMLTYTYVYCNNISNSNEQKPIKYLVVIYNSYLKRFGFS